MVHCEGLPPTKVHSVPDLKTSTKNCFGWKTKQNFNFNNLLWKYMLPSYDNTKVRTCDRNFTLLQLFQPQNSTKYFGEIILECQKFHCFCSILQN